ncbi:MAG: hypothetical protein JXM72_00330 [Deltaproteobacteria bacterium]|nr:hypothetical protein [Deltaproteobacteria bacterium]
MALPKKRKKLENIAGNSTASDMTGNTATKNRRKKRTEGSAGTAGSKKSEQMSKAFEIMDRIESPDDLPHKPLASDTPALQGSPAGEERKTPERIRFRISLDRKTNASAEQITGPGSGHELDFGITIPSFIWKIPVLKKAAEKVLLRLSTHE